MAFCPHPGPLSHGVGEGFKEEKQKVRGRNPGFESFGGKENRSKN